VLILPLLCLSFWGHHVRHVCSLLQSAKTKPFEWLCNSAEFPAYVDAIADHVYEWVVRTYFNGDKVNSSKDVSWAFETAPPAARLVAHVHGSQDALHLTFPETVERAESLWTPRMLQDLAAALLTRMPQHYAF
jgi:hypothetical protein